MTSCLNMAVLDELIDLMGEEMDMLLTFYIDDSQEKLKLLAKMDLELEQEAIFRMVHSLKGTSRNMGVVDFSNYCEKIESLARTGNLTQVDFQLSEFDHLFEQAVVQLKEWIRSV